MSLDFKKNIIPFTLGVEMEIQILDKKTLQLTPKAPDILENLQQSSLTKEMFRSTLEVITGVCNTVDDVAKDLTDSILKVESLKESMNIDFSGTGTNPSANYRERLLTATPRYHELMDRNQWLIQRMAVYGLHIHIGMPNGDACMRFNNFFMQLVPHLIAISASSPFWQGHNTGLAACRPTVYEAHPTSGMPHLFSNWKQFSNRYDELIRTGSIKNMKDIWWDMRPSPAFGTLELRICDGPASLAELLAIVAFVHVLTLWFEENESFFNKQNPEIPESWILRENKWRAIRHGLDAEFINHRSLRTFPMRSQIMKWLGMTKPFYDKLGYDHHYDVLEQIIKRGNSSERQLSAFEKSGKIESVLELNAMEFSERRPIWEN